MTAPRLRRTLGPGPTVVVIGYPAPAAVQIVDELLRSDARTIACVVSPDRWSDARSMHRAAQERGRIRLFEGSAATPGLGLPHTAWRILDTADEIYGVASAADLATRHIQEFADECPRLREVHLVALDSDDRGGLRRPSVLWTPLRRALGALTARIPVRASVDRLTSAWSLGVAEIARVRPVARAIQPWKDLRDFDIEAALSWEEIERDLRPGDAA